MTSKQKDDGWALLVTAVVSASLSSNCTVLLTSRWLSNRHAESSSADTLAAVTPKRSKGDPYNAEPRTGQVLAKLGLVQLVKLLKISLLMQISVMG